MHPVNQTFERILDPRLGIVRTIARRALHPHFSPDLVCVVAQIADTTRFCAWPSDPTATGCAWWDAAAATHAALGEAIERYCGNLVPNRVFHASYNDCRAAGVPAVAPAEIALFSPEQYDQPGFPFTRLTDDLCIDWIEGHAMHSNAHCLVPASLVYVTYPRAEGPTRAAPVTNPVIVAGIAAGVTRADAECAALEELIERDAVTVAWLTEARLDVVALPDQLSNLFAGPAHQLETTIIAFPNPYDLPVLGALVYDRETGVIALGTACRPTPKAAMLKAYAEAAQLHMLAYALDDPHSSLMQAVQKVPNSSLKPWRADRSYAQSYRADWRDVTDLLCQLQLYRDPTMRSYLDARLRDAASVTMDQLAGGATRERRVYFERLRAADTPLVSVDLTTPDIARLGLSVVRVVGPGLCTNTPAAFPLLGARRVQPCTSQRQHIPPLPYA